MMGDLICYLLLLTVNAENKKLRSARINHATQVPAGGLLPEPQATVMPCCSCKATDISEDSLCNRSQKPTSLPTFQGSILGHHTILTGKTLKKIYILEAAEIFLIFTKRAALNNFKNFKKQGTAFTSSCKQGSHLTSTGKKLRSHHSDMFSSEPCF